MRLSEWRKAAPTEGAMNDLVLAVVGPVLADLGAERDPECWVAWGEDPDLRYSLLAPTLAGLITVAIRFTSPEDGPRVIAKLVRWSKVSVSELGLDSGGGHRMVAVQVENLVLKGMDEEADRICKFVRILIAGVDDRLQVPVPITAVSGVAPVVAAPVAALRASVRTVAPTSAAALRAAQGWRQSVGPREAARKAQGPEADGAKGHPRPRPPCVPAALTPTALPSEVAQEPPVRPVTSTLVTSAPTAAVARLVPWHRQRLPPASGRPALPLQLPARAAARHATPDLEPAVPTRPQNGEPEPEPDRSGVGQSASDRGAGRPQARQASKMDALTTIPSVAGPAPAEPGRSPGARP